MRSAEEGARRVRNSCTWQHAPATHGSKHLAPRRRASGTSQSGLKVASQGLSRQEVAGWCAPLSPASRKALFTESKCNAIPGRIVSCRVTTPRRQQRKQACREGHNEAVGHHYCACARKRAARRAKGARLCLSQAEIQHRKLATREHPTGSQQFCALEAAYVTARFHTMGPGTIPHYDDHDHPDALSCFPSAVANAGRFPEELFGDWKNGRNVSCFSSSASPP